MATVLELRPIGSSHAPTSCLCIGCNGSGHVARPLVVLSGLAAADARVCGTRRERLSRPLRERHIDRDGHYTAASVPVRRSVARKRSSSATTVSGSSIHALWPAPGTRMRRRFGFVATRASPSSGDPQGVVFGPEEKRRRRQGSPALAEDQLASVPEAAPIRNTRNQAEPALDVPSRVRDVDVEQQVVESLWMLDEELAPELPAPVPRRSRE